MTNELTAAQLKEKNPAAWSMLEEVYNKLHKDELGRYMELYGFVKVDVLINHHVKYMDEGGVLTMIDPRGAIFRWKDATGWVKSGSVFVN